MVAPAAVVAVQDVDQQAKQRFYNDVTQKNYSDAFTEADAYLARHPDDNKFGLDVAYAELSAGHVDDAKARLHRLTQCGDPTVASAALRQLDAMQPVSGAGPAFVPVGRTRDNGYMYVYSQNESRFQDTFSGMFLRYDLGTNAIRPYVALNVAYDTRSGVPGIAQVYNDNAAVASFGIRAPIGMSQYGYVFASAGESVGLRGERTFPETRYGVAYSRDYGTMFNSRPHSQVNVSAAVYSRYAGNAIGYFQGSRDERITPGMRGLYGANVGLDGQRLYYNNFAEGYAGLIFPLTHEINFRVVGVEGTYISRGTPIPVSSSYSSARALFVFGANVP
jgi:hypothetical protein